MIWNLPSYRSKITPNPRRFPILPKAPDPKSLHEKLPQHITPIPEKRQDQRAIAAI